MISFTRCFIASFCTHLFLQTLIVAIGIWLATLPSKEMWFRFVERGFRHARRKWLQCFLASKKKSKVPSLRRKYTVLCAKAHGRISSNNGAAYSSSTITTSGIERANCRKRRTRMVRNLFPIPVGALEQEATILLIGARPMRLRKRKLAARVRIVAMTVTMNSTRKPHRDAMKKAMPHRANPLLEAGIPVNRKLSFLQLTVLLHFVRPYMRIAHSGKRNGVVLQGLLL